MIQLVRAIVRLYVVTTQLMFVRTRRRVHWLGRLGTVLIASMLLVAPVLVIFLVATSLLHIVTPSLNRQTRSDLPHDALVIPIQPDSPPDAYPTTSDAPPLGTLGDGTRITVPVSRAIDGDSIEVRIGDRVEQVHLLGIDTPEPGMCFGDRAAIRTSMLTLNQSVTLESDPTQTNRDKYGRLLRYVWLPDGQLLNALLLNEGLAFEYTYYDAYAHQAEFRHQEASARNKQHGLWSVATCNGVGQRPQRQAQNTTISLSPNLSLVPVARVIDGDTIEVTVNGQQERVRLIGIDTPELGRCYADAATTRLTALLSGGQVLLQEDPTQGDRDKFKRLLRYLWLPDGTLINERLLQEGFAYEYTYRSVYAYEQQFMQAEHEAHRNGRGLWSPTTCDAKAGRRYSAAYRSN